MARKATATKASAQPNVPQFSSEQELEAFREMLLIRRFEEKAGQMYGMGLIGGFCTSISARKPSSPASPWPARRARTPRSPATATTVTCWSWASNPKVSWPS